MYFRIIPQTSSARTMRKYIKKNSSNRKLPTGLRNWVNERTKWERTISGFMGWGANIKFFEILVLRKL